MNAEHQVQANTHAVGAAQLTIQPHRRLFGEFTTRQQSHAPSGSGRQCGYRAPTAAHVTSNAPLSVVPVRFSAALQIVLYRNQRRIPVETLCVSVSYAALCARLSQNEPLNIMPICWRWPSFRVVGATFQARRGRADGSVSSARRRLLARSRVRSRAEAMPTVCDTI